MKLFKDVILGKNICREKSSSKQQYNIKNHVFKNEMFFAYTNKPFLSTLSLQTNPSLYQKICMKKA